jgi:hypothetical protein
VAQVLFGQGASIIIENPTGRARPAVGRFILNASSARGGTLNVESGSTTESISLSPDTTTCSISFLSSPGRTVFRLSYDGAPADAPPLINVPTLLAAPFFQIGDVSAWDAEARTAPQTPRIACTERGETRS